MRFIAIIPHAEVTMRKRRENAAPSGACRHCGCTEERGCVIAIPGAPGEVETCYWLDGGRTACSARACAEKETARLLRALDRRDRVPFASYTGGMFDDLIDIVRGAEERAGIGRKA